MVFIKNLHSSDVPSNEDSVLDFNEMKAATPIKEFNDKVVFALNDGLNFSDLDHIIKQLLEKKKKVLIIHPGNKLFRVERHLLKVLRTLKANNRDFLVIGIPLCYIQDFLDFSYDLKHFLFTEEDFSRYHYFEDCRFCRLRKICPGALPKYEDQVFASFKEHFDALDYSNVESKVYKIPRKIDKLRLLFERNEFRNLKLNEQRFLLKNRDDPLINKFFLSFAKYKNKKDVFYTSLQVKEEDAVKLEDKGKYSFRTANKEKVDKKFISFLIDVEVIDQIVIATSSSFLSEIRDFLRPNLRNSIKNDIEANRELLRLLSHKISLFIWSSEDFYFLSKDPVALAAAINLRVEKEALRQLNLGSDNFALIQL